MITESRGLRNRKLVRVEDEGRELLYGLETPTRSRIRSPVKRDFGDGNGHLLAKGGATETGEDQPALEFHGSLPNVVYMPLSVGLSEYANLSKLGC